MQRWNWTALVFTLIGIIVSTYLVVHHYNLIYGMSEAKSFCTLSATIDCDAVNTSSFSTIMGIPVAVLQAFILFIGMLLLLGIRAFGDSERAVISRFFLYLSSGNFIATVAMGVISTFILRTFCLMCASLYLVALVLLICAMKMNPTKPFSMLIQDLKGLLKSSSVGGTRGFLILFLTIPLGAALASGMYEKSILSSTDFEKMIQRNVDDWHDGKQFDFKISSGAQDGNQAASFQIVEFSDFECPHCKRAAPSLHAFVNAHRNEVRFNFQNYPLDKSCNPRGGMHEHACQMARAALCALKQNKFTEAHDWIFAHQDALDDNTVNALAQEIDLDKNALMTCLKDPSTIEELKIEVDRGNSADLQGTPTIFANGKVLPGGFLIPVLEAALKSSK